ncbi:uncharacterized protein L203_102878 [Cryptococcus depauperatus CBS 7841]|uniref:Defect at low temperature protein 1 n=1 Tax=Cryptococcus depauperatus CBS 7841 TaxID=1295531 RepID=A0AAJ8M0Q9_9TREE
MSPSNLNHAHPFSLLTPSATTYPPQQQSSTIPAPITLRTPCTTLQRKYEEVSWTQIRSVLYHSSFWLFIVIITILLVGAAWGLGEQAWRTGGQKNWNTVVLVTAYAVLLIVSIAHAWSRWLSIKRILRTMPKPYIPIKPDDVPEKVAKYIATEYSRTAVIAHISQATSSQQEGWGRPGTKWEDKHFRSYILSTIPILREALNIPRDHPPLSLQPFFSAVSDVKDNGGIRVLINTWAQYIEKARYGKREPEEREAGAVEKLVEIIILTMEIKNRKQDRQEGGNERERAIRF